MVEFKIRLSELKAFYEFVYDWKQLDNIVATKYNIFIFVTDLGPNLKNFECERKCKLIPRERTVVKELL